MPKNINVMKYITEEIIKESILPESLKLMVCTITKRIDPNIIPMSMLKLK